MSDDDPTPRQFAWEAAYFMLAVALVVLIIALSACSTSQHIAAPNGFCDVDLPLTPFNESIGPEPFKQRTIAMYAKHESLCGAK